MDHGPRFLYLQIIRGCNLRCTHCDFWKMDESPDAFSVETMNAMIDEFADIGGKTIVTCGGEPTMAPKKFWPMAGRARDRGLRMFSVMNGTRIKTIEDARLMLNEGPDEITISLDGPDAEMHDKFRGVKGSFELATRALRLLVRARHELKCYDKRIYAMAILCQSLAGNLDRFFQLVLNDIGADKLKLNTIMPTFNAPKRAGHVDPYFEQEMIQDIDSLLLELDACDAKYGVNRNPVWKEDLRMYCKSVQIKRARKSLMWSTIAEQTTDHICNTYERNIMVNDLGHMQLCFSGDFPGLTWRQPGDMRRFWFGDATATTRSEMFHCNRLCAISHSTRRSSSTLPTTLDTVPA